jgi:hypothetical protein
LKSYLLFRLVPTKYLQCQIKSLGNLSLARIWAISLGLSVAAGRYPA